MTDREILRSLAGKIAEIAALPVQEETKELYRAVNSRRMIRPVVLLDELPWNQLNSDEDLVNRCEDPFLREVETNLRRTLWKWNHCRGDMLVEPFYCLNKEIAVGSIGEKPADESIAFDRGNNIISRHLADGLNSFEAVEKLRIPEVTYDKAATERKKDILTDLFGDILPVRLVGHSWAGHFAPWDEIAWWRGVEAIYVDLYDEPELLHATMRKFMQIKQSTLDQLIALDLLDDYSPTLHCTAGLVDDLPGKIEGGKVSPKNMWGRGTAQCFATVSPKMHDEFEIQYVKQYFDQFGLLYYGCCEPLHDKIEILKQFKNLRKISITPWADVRKAAERMGSAYVMARKPNPAAVAVDKPDTEALRRDILETLTLCRENGTSVEFTLKDISSVNYRAENLTEWEKTVMETVKNF